MVTVYFFCAGSSPVARCWSALPRVGETVEIGELARHDTALQVTNVVWEDAESATVKVFLDRVQLGHRAERLTGMDGGGDSANDFVGDGYGHAK